MLTKLIIRQFKRIDVAEIDLDTACVVFVGPNNFGKTSALQALALWGVGLKAWLERRANKKSQSVKNGITLNRKDLIAISVPHANLLWNELRTREITKSEDGQKTKNILIEIIVHGYQETQNGIQNWSCGFEFDYANPESFYCRPLRTQSDGSERMVLPDLSILQEIKIVFLPTMSGLASVEPKIEAGRISVLIGEGQTAQVLRNICYQLWQSSDAKWQALCSDIKKIFGVTILSPVFDQARGEVTMSYRQNHNKETKIELDLSCAGRGFQQTLLLLAYIYANPKSIILLDEPDAHLEILRQKQIYQKLNEVLSEQGGQMIAASHSEAILNEAAEKHTVIAFLGKPHVLNKKDQLLKSLISIGYADYYLAESKGWVLYLEGSTDLEILKVFAETLNHPVQTYLETPFVHYLGTNVPQAAREHFFGIKEAKEDLAGLALYDYIQKPLQSQAGLQELMWGRREIENYFCSESILLKWAGFVKNNEDMLDQLEAQRRTEKMSEAISEVKQALKTIRGVEDIWRSDIKASDDILIPVMRNYANKAGVRPLNKGEFYKLAKLVSATEIDTEVVAVLDAILQVAKSSQPYV